MGKQERKSYTIPGKSYIIHISPKAEHFLIQSVQDNKCDLCLLPVQLLRMQLIDKKIDDEVEINKLRITNKKLVKGITKLELAEAELKLKQKQKQK